MARRVARGPIPAEAKGTARRLWAPWRAAYITGATPGECIFCFGALSARARKRRLILFCGPAASVMLNRYPYNNGHIMVAPRRHVASPELLSQSERTVVGELVTQSVVALRRALKPAGLNLGANVGRVAGAGFADHIHWHIVPRWEGDTNFMPVLGSTRVISQSLEASFALLAPLFKTLTAAVS